MKLLKNLVSLRTMLVMSVFTATGIHSTKLMENISKFALDLFEQCAQLKPTSNILISSISVANSLALLAQGANGSTFDEIKNAFYSPGDKAAIGDQFTEYHKALLDDSSIITMINQIYLHDAYRFREDFRRIAVDQFFAGVEQLNFSNANECAQTINRLIEEKTDHEITDLIQPQMLNGQTQIVLVNGIHFKNYWRYRFNKKCTHRGQFFIDENTSVPVEFMCFDEPSRSRFNKQFDYKVLDDLDATAVGMRYMQTKYSLVIILPNKRMGLADLEAKLKNYNHDLITFSRQQYAHVNVTIPKFQIEFDIELNGILKNLGIVDVFNENADLSGLVETHENVRVSKIVHKAFFTIDEDGTERGAGTGGSVKGKSRTKFYEFRVDHPFVFFLVDRSVNSIIFGGRVVRFS